MCFSMMEYLMTQNTQLVGYLGKMVNPPIMIEVKTAEKLLYLVFENSWQSKEYYNEIDSNVDCRICSYGAYENAVEIKLA